MFKEDLLSEDGNSVVIKKFTEFEPVDPKIDSWLSAHPDRVGVGCVIDTETTGLNSDDEVIEVALRLFKYDRETMRIACHSDGYNALGQPSKEISEEITRITGLTNEDVAGKSIDWSEVDQLLEQADFLIAHNASFDRPMVEKYSKISAKKLWCCSVEQIDWEEKGFSSKKQEILGIYHGFFYPAHRAQVDVDALLRILSYKNAGYLEELLVNARKSYALVKAKRSDFDSKDELKAHGFRWNGDDKYWYKKIQAEEVEEMKGWLKDVAYRKVSSNFKFLEIDLIEALDNFKSK